MPEYESVVADAMNNLADALRTLAGCAASIAAGAHSSSEGRQRELAAVFFSDAQTRFADVLRKLDPKTEQELNTFIDNLCKGKSKR